MVKAYQPKVEVTLVKVVQRDRNRTQAATGPDSIIDLTPYLSEGSVVQHSRGINKPAGVFSIDFPDKPLPQSGDTLYSMIEPMDIIEIRMAREPHKYNRIPVVFRGFVDFIKRRETINHDGKPQRRIVVSGLDWGGIMQSILIFYKKDYALGKIIMDSFPMFSAYGVKFEYLKPADFVSEIVNKIVNPWLKELRQKAHLQQELLLNVKASVAQGRVGLYGMQAHEGSIWNLMTRWTDLPWNELIFDDDDDGAHLLYRARPYHDVTTRDLIMVDAVEPGRVKLQSDAVVSLNSERNTRGLFNYFHVETPQDYMNDAQLINVQSMQNGTAFKVDVPNIDPIIYGIRKTSETSMMTSVDNTNSVADKTSDIKEVYKDRHHTWLEKRRDDLINMRRDNAALESGTMTLRGDENIKPGVYIDIERGALEAEYYAQNVTQVYEVYGSYTTEVEFIRGTGFINRLETPNYLNEYSAGVYAQR